jgi:hypothetical protein
MAEAKFQWEDLAAGLLRGDQSKRGRDLIYPDQFTRQFFVGSWTASPKTQLNPQAPETCFWLSQAAFTETIYETREEW